MYIHMYLCLCSCSDHVHALWAMLFGGCGCSLRNRYVLDYQSLRFDGENSFDTFDTPTAPFYALLVYNFHCANGLLV